MKKFTKLLAWVLVVSMFATALPATALPVYAGENESTLATDANARVYSADNSGSEWIEFWLSADTYFLELMKGESGTFSVTPVIEENTQNVQPEFSYQWSYYDKNSNQYVDIEGANSSSLEVTGQDSSVKYRVTATMEYRIIDTDTDTESTYRISTDRTFTVYHKSGITVSSKKSYFAVEYGKSVTMKVNVKDNNPGANIVSYTWYKADKDYEESDNDTVINGATTDSCTVTVTGTQFYYCVVKDSTGDTNKMWFSVRPSVGLTVDTEQNEYRVVSGQNLTLSVNATTKRPASSLKYEWKVKNYDDYSEYGDISGGDSNSCTVNNITKNLYALCKVTAVCEGYEETSYQSFKIYATKYGLNVTSNVYNKGNHVYVKNGKNIKFNVTSSGGTIDTEWTGLTQDEESTIAQNGSEYSFTPSTTGDKKFKAYIKEDEEDSYDIYTKYIHAFDEVGMINIGTTTSVNVPATEISIPDKYVGYKFTAPSSGDYSIYTDKVEEFVIVTEDGRPSYKWTDADSVDGSIIPATMYLEANKTYYLVAESNGNYEYDGNNQIYVPAQARQFNVTIKRSEECLHPNTRIDNATAPTCTTAGYTGDTYCTECNELLAAGTVIPATGHTLEVRNIVAASCETAGYTGDKYCTTCGALVENGTAIPATGHVTEVRNAKAASSRADGYTGDTVCTKCGATVATGTKIYKIKTVTVRSNNTYTGKKIQPAVVVKDTKGKKISSANYSVTYSKDCKSVGIKQVKVTFKGKYSGTVKVNYTIVPKNTSSVSASSKSGKLIVKWKKQTKQTTGYQIQYSVKKNFTGAKTVTVGKNTSTSKTIKSLKKGSTYYIRIRTYKKVGKKIVASSWSKAKKVKIK